MSQDEDHWVERLRNAVSRLLSHYLVALAGAYQPRHHDDIPSGRPRFFCLPGFILEIAGRWLFVTAGHNLQSFYEAYKDTANKWVGMAWTHFVPDCDSVRTLPLDNTVSRHVDAKCDVVGGEECGPVDGTEDWGVFELTQPERQWMTDAGVQTFSLDDLCADFPNWFVLIGLPTEFFDPVSIGEHGATGGVEPALIQLKKRDDLISQSKNTWFIGELFQYVTFDLHGMSGGPLFAIDVERVRLFIVGVQSHWCPNKRLSFVCPGHVIADRLPQKYHPAS